MTYGKISKKQQEILEYIKSEILNRGFPPAVRESFPPKFIQPFLIIPYFS